MFLSPGGSHYRRGPYGERYFHPAADGWYPERSHRSARPVLVDTSAPFPGQPLAAWPAAVPGEDFVPPTGRGVARFVSDPTTARCTVCRRVASGTVTKCGWTKTRYPTCSSPNG